MQVRGTITSTAKQSLLLHSFLQEGAGGRINMSDPPQSPWEVWADPSGKLYYYNRQTMECRWEPPLELASRRLIAPTGDQGESGRAR